MKRQLLGTIGAGVLAMATMAAAPVTALAGHRDGGGWDRGHDHSGGLRIGVDLPPVVVQPPVDEVYCQPAQTQVWVEPVYRTVSERQWVPATYRTVSDRVWVEPVVRNDCARVLVADRYEWRDVVHYEYGYRRVIRERVLVEPAHYVDQPQTAVVTPGHYEDVQRQELVCDGHWETVERQELVYPGHWETRQMLAERPFAADNHGGLSVEVHLPLR
jgi:hypothetical protein